MAHVDFVNGRHHSRTAPIELETTSFFETNLFKIVLLVGLTAMVLNGQISLSFHFGDGDQNRTEQKNKANKASLSFENDAPTTDKKQRVVRASVEMPAGSESNFTFAVDPDFANRNGISNEKVAEKMAFCKDYVRRFYPVAVAEMRKFGIPASIILAQGLLESDAGQSRLARSTNNHFGIKCFSRKCAAGHCQNFTDDSHKDFFVKYGSAWGSFRAHSEFLKSTDRYSKLFKLPSADCVGWARGLAKAGYATDKKYAEKLIALIQSFDLHRFDE